MTTFTYTNSKLILQTYYQQISHIYYQILTRSDRNKFGS